MFIILMRRIAAHYVWCKQVYRMHYIELDDNGAFHGVYPLNEEIAGTAFYDGVLVPVLSSEPAIGFKQVAGVNRKDYAGLFSPYISFKRDSLGVCETRHRPQL